MLCGGAGTRRRGPALPAAGEAPSGGSPVEIGDMVWLGIGIAVLAVAAALVPALVEVRRAARSLDRALEGVHGRLPGLLERA